MDLIKTKIINMMLIICIKSGVFDNNESELANNIGRKVKTQEDIINKWTLNKIMEVK